MIVFHILLILSSILLGMFWHKHQKDFKSIHSAQLIQLYLSLSVLETLSLGAQIYRNNFIIFLFLTWIWTLVIFNRILDNVSNSKKNAYQNLSFVIFGFFISFILYYQKRPVEIYMLPVALSFLGVGLRLFFLGVKKIKNLHDQGERYFIISCLGMLLAKSLWFLNVFNTNLWAIDIALSVLFVFGITLTALLSEFTSFQLSHKKELDTAIEKRDENLLVQSKYSELGMMSAGIAHEINNPLTIIQAKVSQMLRFYKDIDRQKDIREGLEQILYTSDRIGRTIQGVRDFVHQDENLVLQQFTLKTLIDDVMAFCLQRFKNHGISIRLYGFNHLLMRGHKIQLEQVILNLLNNAFDAIEFLPEKWIELSASETEQLITITIKDSGHGIPREIADKMMNPFFTTKKNGKGTGLGLVLARGIVEKHGGNLTYVYDSPHTTFKIQLPKYYEFQLPEIPKKESAALH